MADNAPRPIDARALLATLADPARQQMAELLQAQGLQGRTELTHDELMKATLAQAAAAFKGLEALAPTLAGPGASWIPDQVEQAVRQDPSQARAIAQAFADALQAIGERQPPPTPGPAGS